MFRLMTDRLTPSASERAAGEDDAEDAETDGGTTAPSPTATPSAKLSTRRDEREGDMGVLWVG